MKNNVNSEKYRNSDLYYFPPKDETFEEVKSEAIKIWQGYNDKYEYGSNKIDRIKFLKNVGDNFMYIVAMFDPSNQKLLASKISQQAKKAIRQRLIAGGQIKEYLYF